MIKYSIFGNDALLKKSIEIGIVMVMLFYGYFSYSNAQDAQSYYQNGYHYFSQGNYQKAEENYQKAIELSPNFENAHYWLGKVYRQTGQYDKAIIQWMEVLKINPRNPYAFRYLNESFRNTSKVTSKFANDYLLEGLKILGITEGDMFLNEEKVGNYTLLSAIPYLKEAIKLDSNLIRAHWWLAETYLALSKKITWQYTSLAIASFEQVITIEETNNPSHFQRPSEYWFAYQKLMQVFENLGLKERKENLLNQLQKAKAVPYETVLNDAGYRDFGYPDSIEIISKNFEEIIEIWRYESKDKAFRIINKKVIGEENI